MDITEKDNILQQITDAQVRIESFKSLSEEIARLQDAVGKITQVNFITDGQVVAVRDADMMTKAEGALQKLITAKQLQIDEL